MDLADAMQVVGRKDGSTSDEIHRCILRGGLHRVDGGLKHRLDTSLSGTEQGWVKMLDLLGIPYILGCTAGNHDIGRHERIASKGKSLIDTVPDRVRTDGHFAIFVLADTRTAS